MSGSLHRYVTLLEAAAVLFIHRRCEFLLQRNELEQGCFSSIGKKESWSGTIFECGFSTLGTSSAVIVTLICMGQKFTSYTHLSTCFSGRRCYINKGQMWVMRLVFFSIAASLSVYLVFMPFNYHHGQHWWCDRAILLSCCVLVLCHPLFVFPSMMQAVWMLGAWKWPGISTFNIADKALPLELMLLVTVWQCVVACTGVLRRSNHKRSLGALFLSAAYITGVLYYKPFIRKMDLGWHTLPNQVYHLAPNAHHQLGLYVFLSQSFRSALFSAGSYLNGGFVAYTCLVELILPTVFAFHWACACLLFVAGACLHIGIFLLSGILFWKWAICDLSLAAGLFWLVRHGVIHKRAFNPVSGLILGYMLYTNSLPLQHAPMLAWYDTPASFHFSFELVGSDHRRYLLPPYSMAPYDIQFAQSRFSSILYEQPLVGCLGATQDRTLALNLRKWTFDSQLNLWEVVPTIKQLKLFTHKRATPKQPFVNELVSLLKKKIEHSISTRSCRSILSSSHVWSFPAKLFDDSASVDEVYCGQANITHIEVFYSFQLYDAALSGKPVQVSYFKAMSVDYISGAVSLYRS